MSVAQDMIVKLTADGVVDGSWPGYAQRQLPPEPDQLIQIIQQGGAPAEVSSVIRYPFFQVLVRGAKGEYDAIQAKMEAVYQSLHPITNETVNSVSYAYVLASSDELDLGPDDNQRQILSRNFRAAINN